MPCLQGMQANMFIITIIIIIVSVKLVQLSMFINRHKNDVMFIDLCYLSTALLCTVPGPVTLYCIICP